MITYKQIKKTSEIVALSDYYVLDVRTTGPNPSVNAITSISMLCVEDDTVAREAVVRIRPDSESDAAADSGYYRAEQVADSMSRFLLGQTVISEPTALKFLRSLLEQYGYSGEIRFVPVSKLVAALFPEASPGSIPELADRLNIPERENAGLTRTAWFEYLLFQKCRTELGASVSTDPELEAVGGNPDEAEKKKLRISSRTLKHWAKSVWSVSPWVVVAGAFLLVLVFVTSLPRKENTEVDRNAAPVHYLVLSWDQTGKYGTRTRPRGSDEDVIEFRVPYGVYNVLNNNSIPVELNIITEENRKAKPTPSPSPSPSPSADGQSAEGAVATELSSSAEIKQADISLSEEEEDTGPQKITMRPNSQRQITIDTDQYLTLSNDAKDLILFYLSEVPEEKESDTTGRDDGSSSRVVYAYVKGTEVRFRKSPSLEGAVIDSLQNGQQVQVLGVTGEWTHVAVQNTKGYIFSQFLTSEDPQAAAYEARKAEEAAQNPQSTEPTAAAPSGDTADSAPTPGSTATGADMEPTAAAGSPEAVDPEQAGILPGGA